MLKGADRIVSWGALVGILVGMAVGAAVVGAEVVGCAVGARVGERVVGGCVVVATWKTLNKSPSDSYSL